MGLTMGFTCGPDLNSRIAVTRNLVVPTRAMANTQNREVNVSYSLEWFIAVSWPYLEERDRVCGIHTAPRRDTLFVSYLDCRYLCSCPCHTVALSCIFTSVLFHEMEQSFHCQWNLQDFVISTTCIPLAARCPGISWGNKDLLHQSYF